MVYQSISVCFREVVHRLLLFVSGINIPTQSSRWRIIFQSEKVHSIKNDVVYL